MNYLGHLYFSGDDRALMLANLFGDFVKGTDYSYLPPIVRRGVKLHREIDDFIDHHPVITNLRLKLYEDLPKIAGIAIDLYMDHLLAKNWHKFHHKSLQDFTQSFFSYALKPSSLSIKQNEGAFNYPNDFVNLIEIMYRKKWITRYEYLEGLEMASTGLSRRISFPNNLHEAKDVFVLHQVIIEESFNNFMFDAKKHFLNNG